MPDIIDFGTAEMLDTSLTEKYNYLLGFYEKKLLDEYLQENIFLLEELYEKTQPKKVEIGSLFGKTNKTKYLVNSPDGFVPVTDCIQKIKEDMYEIGFSNNVKINASHDHLFQKSDLSWHYAKNLKIGDVILSQDGVVEITSINPYRKQTIVYDLSVEHKNHRYYTAGVCSHNSGKSLVLMNLALNWLLQGLSGVYITLELSEELTSLRTDAMLLGQSTKNIRKNIEDTALKVKLQKKKMGEYRIKDLPAQSNINAIRAYIKELQIQTGMKIDFVIVDYLDLLMPVSVKVNLNDQFIKDKYVSEELRNLAKELNVLMVTASQLNRSAVEEIEFDHSHIAGGISKINTADYVFGIFTSRSMRERGKYQIQCMKSRSSTGVGQKIDLEYNIETMRITDEDPDKSKTAPETPSSIMEKIKNRRPLTDGTNNNEDIPKIKVDSKTKQLDSLLQKLKKDNK
jgi:KaiC/GvpD/RAD55 family RecA-like ATPase